MDGRTKVVAALLTGSMEATVALGRLDYSDRFQPFGSLDTVVEVFQKDGNVYAKFEGDIPYTWDSPRIITHVAMLISDAWLVTPTKAVKGFHMSPGDVMTAVIIRNIGEYGLGPNL